MNKTRPQPVSERQVGQFLADARKRAVAARKNLSIDAETAYQIAYEAMIKGSLALMLSHGERPRKQLGHHIAIIEFASRKLSNCGAATFALFDRMRRKRNDAFYDIAVVSDTEAEEAVSICEAYLSAVTADIDSRFPEI
jgi:uncharacterized protein (UPF0332 family)